jgi:DNA replication and repair protein RecF
MRLKRLVIENFRNLSGIDVSLSAGLNHFYGDNGAGKTALLEAIHFLFRGRSFRTQQLRDLVSSGADHVIVRAELEDEQGIPRMIGIKRALDGSTEVRLDGESVQRISEVAAITPLQTLLPDVADLVFGGPSQRRSWLDWGMFHVKPEYLPILRDYLRVLKQRNAVLRSGNLAADQIEPWNLEFVALAHRVTDLRIEYLQLFKEHLQTALSALTPELEVTTDYARGWSLDENLEKLLGERVQSEVKSGFTQWGPHRADIRFRSAGSEASRVLSRGQGKLLATALKVAQVSLLKAETRRDSIFLIDDVGAELDQAHSQRFFRLLQELQSQVVSTSVQKADRSHYGFPAGEIEMFHVEQGAVIRDL